jgi:glutaredoxin
MLFALSTCSHCKEVKRLLDSRDVEYRTIEVDLLEGEDRKKAIEEVKQYNSRATFPTTVIGDTVIVGSKKDQIKEALAQL